MDLQEEGRGQQGSVKWPDGLFEMYLLPDFFFTQSQDHEKDATFCATILVSRDTWTPAGLGHILFASDNQAAA